MHVGRWLAGAAFLAAPGWMGTSVMRAQDAAALPLKLAPRATAPAITVADLMTRLYQYADDSMAGRASGTEGQLKATAYLAAEARRLGLTPAGDAGSYFQVLPLVARGFESGGAILVGERRFVLGEDFGALVARGGSVVLPYAAPVIYGGELGDSATWISADAARGRIVVMRQNPRALQLSTRGLTVSASSRFADAVAWVVPLWDQFTPPMRRSLSSTTLAMSGGATAPLPPTFVASAAMSAALLAAAAPAFTGTVTIELRFLEVAAPARNVVAILPGSDASLRGQYVAVGAHNDHLPVAARSVDHDSLRAARMRRNGSDTALARSAGRRDSIRNGADDDGSGTVAVLEMAESLATAPVKPKRSILFVWHAAEELGLLGAEWFTTNPTVPLDSIVAQLNLDMVGRGGVGDIGGGGPAYVQLVGSRRLSSEMGDLVERLNARRAQPFVFDYALDANGHPENIYCRSDHAKYARYGIPVTFFTTGLHRDYHQVTDEPQYIEYDKLAELTRFVLDVTLEVANRPARLKLDRSRPDPKGGCKQ